MMTNMHLKGPKYEKICIPIKNMQNTGYQFGLILLRM